MSGRAGAGWLDALLLFYTLTAAVGLWAGYDRTGALAIFDNPVGWPKFGGLVLAALLGAGLARLRTPQALRWALAALAGLGAAIALAFVSRCDWAEAPVNWSVLRELGQGWQRWLCGATCPPGPGPNINAVAGVLAPLLCLDAGLLAEVWQSRPCGRGLWLLWGTLTALVMAPALLVTSSRGAWLGLSAALYLLAVWRGLGRRYGKFLAWVARDGLTVAMLLLLPWFRALLLRQPDIANRVWIFTRGALLVRDFPFTGSGLGNFALLDSTYAELIHVPTLPYGHAVLLDAAIEQGLPGALALAAIGALALWRGLWALGRHARAVPPTLAAALLALVVVMVHGLVDTPYGSSRFLPLLFAPPAMVLASLRVMDDAPTARQRWAGGVLVAGVALAAGWGVWQAGPALPAAWHANLGAVAQAHVELPPYDYQRFWARTLDQIRQEEDFNVAEARYRRALALDPTQVTARTRLAQLALSRGEYEAALAHARAAWDAGYRDRVVTMTYSDALIAQGAVAEGAALVRGLPRAAMRLEWQWYRYRSRDDVAQQRYVEQALEWIR